MASRQSRLPRLTQVWTWLAFLLIGPVSVTLHMESAVSADDRAEASAANLQAGDATSSRILNLDIKQLATVSAIVPLVRVPVASATGRGSTVQHSSAAIIVLAPKVICRSGAVRAPETLRIASGLGMTQTNFGVSAELDSQTDHRH